MFDSGMTLYEDIGE